MGALAVYVIGAGEIARWRLRFCSRRSQEGTRPLAKPSASLSARRRLVVCDVSALVEPDLATVDALARMAMVAGRQGCQVQLRHASPELRELLALAGLADVVRCVAGSGFESRR